MPINKTFPKKFIAKELKQKIASIIIGHENHNTEEDVDFLYKNGDNFGSILEQALSRINFTGFGGKILILEGEYHITTTFGGDLFVGNYVTIEGIGAQTVIIEDDGMSYTRRIFSGNPLNSTFKNFKWVKGMPTLSGTNQIGTAVVDFTNCSGVMFDNITFSGVNAGYTILIGSGSSASNYNITIRNCRFLFDSEHIYAGDCIYLQYTNCVKLQNNYFHNTGNERSPNIQTNVFGDVRFNSCENILIGGNMFTEDVLSGTPQSNTIFLESSSNVVVTDNKFYGIKRLAILSVSAGASKNVLFAKNVVDFIADTSGNNVITTGAGGINTQICLAIVDNYLSANNNGVGIFSTTSSQIQIAGNIIRRFTTGLNTNGQLRSAPFMLAANQGMGNTTWAVLGVTNPTQIDNKTS